MTEGDVLTGFQFLDQLAASLAFIVFVIANGWLGDLIMSEKLSSVPGIFAGDEVGFFEHPQGAQSDVFKIAYGSCDNVKCTSHH